jgi:cell wall-associated protease
LRTGRCFTGPPGPCAAESALDNDEIKLTILRRFRDEVLSKTPEGRNLINLYYKWNPTIVRELDQNAQYKEEIKRIIDGIVPMIQ